MLPLISPKPFAEYSAQEYHGYVQGMWAMRVKRGAKPKSPAPGITVMRTKKGALTVRRSKARAFDYITYSEMAALATQAKCSQADLWQLLKKRNYIVTQSRMEAEVIYAGIKELPW